MCVIETLRLLLLFLALKLTFYLLMCMCCVIIYDNNNLCIIIMVKIRSLHMHTVISTVGCFECESAVAACILLPDCMRYAPCTDITFTVSYYIIQIIIAGGIAIAKIGLRQKNYYEHE